jgi:hypothetical protein
MIITNLGPLPDRTSEQQAAYDRHVEAMKSSTLLAGQAKMVTLLNLKRELEEELKIAAKAWAMDSDHGAGFVRGLKRALFHVRVELGETNGEI